MVMARTMRQDMGPVLLWGVIGLAGAVAIGKALASAGPGGGRRVISVTTPDAANNVALAAAGAAGAKETATVFAGGQVLKAPTEFVAPSGTPSVDVPWLGVEVPRIAGATAVGTPIPGTVTGPPEAIEAMNRQINGVTIVQNPVTGALQDYSVGIGGWDNLPSRADIEAQILIAQENQARFAPGDMFWMSIQATLQVYEAALTGR